MMKRPTSSNTYYVSIIGRKSSSHYRNYNDGSDGNVASVKVLKQINRLRVTPRLYYYYMLLLFGCISHYEMILLTPVDAFTIQPPPHQQQQQQLLLYPKHHASIASTATSSSSSSVVNSKPFVSPVVHHPHYLRLKHSRNNNVGYYRLASSSTTRSSRNSFHHPSEQNADNIDEDKEEETKKMEDRSCELYQSHITTIRCQNIGGMINYSHPNDPNSTNDNDSDKTAVRALTTTSSTGSSANNEIEIHLGNDPSLVAITGETGSGKSLLVSKVVNYVTGNTSTKGAHALLPSTGDSSFVTGEVSLTLSEPHISLTKAALIKMGLNPSLLLQSSSNVDVTDTDCKDTLPTPPTTTNTVQLTFKRITERLPTSTSKKGRIRNTCQINKNNVTLKTLRAIASPLIATVDAAAAASALGQPKARIQIIDSWLRPTGLRDEVSVAKVKYRARREVREGLENELRERVLPSSFVSTTADSDSDGEENVELLTHWIDELDEFESRIDAFQDAIVSSRGVASLLSDTPPSSDMEDVSFHSVLRRLSSCRWTRDDDDDDDDDDGDSTKTTQTSSTLSPSLLYTVLLDLRDAVKTIDAQLIAARSSCDVLSSLSSSNSVRTALEQSRNFLFDAATTMDGSGIGTSSRNYNDDDDNDDYDDRLHDPVVEATERSHELLNTLEEALDAAAQFMEDNPQGLISTLENRRRTIDVSIEDIDTILADWGSLSRKHGIPSISLLPSCHRSLRQELDGNVEARMALPNAKEEEAIALQVFEEGCLRLTDARREVGDRMTERVTTRLASLGMEGSVFKVRLNEVGYGCSDHAAYGKGAVLGLDGVDFLLLHRGNREPGDGDARLDLPKTTTNDIDTNTTMRSNTEANNDKQRGGKLDLVGSAGEKARILLAIETDFPGSVGTSMSYSNNNNNKNLSYETSGGIGTTTTIEESFNECFPPVAVVYDEIDAHVGGRAAVAVANLLSEQTRWGNDDNNDSTSSSLLPPLRRRGQVISITHSPSIAAIADRHVMVQKILVGDTNKLPLQGNNDGHNGGGNVEVSVQCVDGIARRKELARMASGDLAPEAAELFADALLRDGLRRRDLLDDT